MADVLSIDATRRSLSGIAVVVTVHGGLETRKSKAFNGKPQTMARKPAPTECHLIQPIAKSTIPQIKKKTMGLRRFIPPALSSCLALKA